MGEFYRGAKTKHVLGLMRKCGLKIIPGGNHDKAVAQSGRIIPIPRHKDLSNGVVEDICLFLLDEGCDAETIRKHLK